MEMARLYLNSKKSEYRKGVVGLKTIQKPWRLHLHRSSYAAERQAPISISNSDPLPWIQTIYSLL